MIFRKNRILFFLVIITIVSFIGSIFLTGIIDNTTKKDIHTNIIKILDSKDIQNKLLTKNTFFVSFSRNISVIILIWLLGISVIGIPVILVFYIFKVLLLAWNIFFLISHFSWSNFGFILLYLSASIIFLIILFILCYYAISYSLILINLLCKKRESSIHYITERYIKILLICFILSLFLSLIEGYFIPKILTFL